MEQSEIYSCVHLNGYGYFLFRLNTCILKSQGRQKKTILSDSTSISLSNSKVQR